MEKKEENVKDQLLINFFKHCKLKNLTKEETLEVFTKAYKRHKIRRKTKNMKNLQNPELQPQSKKLVHFLVNFLKLLFLFPEIY